MRHRDKLEFILAKEVILDGLINGTIEFVKPDEIDDSMDGQTRIAKDFLSYPEHEKEDARRKLHYLKAIANAGITTFTKSSIQSTINEVAKRISDPKKPHWNTVYRWHKRYLISDGDVRALAPRQKHQGNYKRKIPPEVATFINDAIESTYLTPERPSMANVHKEVIYQIFQENKHRENGFKLPTPSYNTVRRTIKSLDPFLVAERQFGKKAALRMFKAYKEGVVTTRSLERVEIDHTPSDLIVVDDASRLPLGRPTLTSMIDHFSKSILGFYLSFSPPSALSVMECMKHAIMPKHRINEIYPKLINTWDVYGLPEELIVDNGKEFLGKDLEDVCTSLEINIQFCPVREPWYKSSVERHFRTINSKLLDKQKGKTFSNIFLKGEYDPKKNAYISFSAFVEIMHHWVIDIYQQSYHETIKMKPAAKWKETIDLFPPTLPRSMEELNIQLGLVNERKIQHYGIEIHGLKYNSDELGLLRRKIKKNRLVKIKYNPSDISYIHVLDPVNDTFLMVMAVNQIYTANKTLWQHDVIKNYARTQGHKTIDMNALMEAESHIRNIMNREVFNSKNVSMSQRQARFENVRQNTQNQLMNTGLRTVEVVEGHSPKRNGLNGLSDLGIAASTDNVSNLQNTDLNNELLDDDADSFYDEESLLKADYGADQ